MDFLYCIIAEEIRQGVLRKRFLMSET